MKFLRILFLLVFTSPLATWAQSLDLDYKPKKKAEPVQRELFNPLVSTTARTLPKWKVGFQRSGGANINTNLLNNALSVGVMERLELGTAPVFYVSSPGSFNYMAKVNFYRGDSIDWSATYAESRFEGEVVERGVVTENPNLVLRSLNVGFNTRPVAMPNVTISPFLNTVCTYLDSSESRTYAKSLECKTEWGLDWQYRYDFNKWLTFAYGQVRKSGISAYEDLHPGYGLAWSMFRSNAFISRPSVGLFHTPDTNNTLLLVSTTFYEK